MKVWEVESLGDGDEHSYTGGLYSTLDKAKASVEGAVWEQPQRGPGYPFAQVTHGSGYYDDGEYWISFTHYYIRERQVL